MNERPYSRSARIGYIALAWLFAVAVGIQTFVAGLSLFVDSSQWSLHAGLARFLAFVPLLMIVLAWSARMPAIMVWRSAALLGMVIGMFLTAILSSRIGFLSALHPVIALMLLLGTANILRSSRHPVVPAS
ncbi:hypothetical protein J19TS2_37770 [Cohnella xylanilytica]|uniref:Uncharacterized protein n=1 Tax=Cohnella xylanilytica TaxID=557555 RepID=A0A841TQW5_9BACL|nr:DUF6220 domain-containing protein [Cohnella xylanilytica]MBB6690545.1 hypothetical protein [Cohnella xylanilytica]GIO14222.1 hypothetical protein J19TS2_37770 [Cohnella xylanilytica]